MGTWSDQHVCAADCVRELDLAHGSLLPTAEKTVRMETSQEEMPNAERGSVWEQVQSKLFNQDNLVMADISVRASAARGEPHHPWGMCRTVGSMMCALV